LAVCFATLLGGVPASANTYTIYNLTTDSYLPVGIDDFGNVLIDTIFETVINTPEPSTLALFGTGALDMAGIAARRFGRLRKR